jgi:hypothetical protein
MLLAYSIRRMKPICNGHLVQNDIMLLYRCYTSFHDVHAMDHNTRNLRNSMEVVRFCCQRRQFSRIRGRVGRNQKKESETVQEEEEKETTTTTTTKKKKMSQWAILKEVWRQYKWTWKGFFTDKDKLPPDHLIYRTKEEEEEEEMRRHQKQDDAASTEDTTSTTTTLSVVDILRNLRRNISQLRTEGPKVAQQITGLTSQDEVKLWVGDQMRLALDCISHFMQGYREGRDMEIQNILTDKYLNAIKEEDTQSTDNNDTRKGRRRRRRRRQIKSL